MFQNIDNCSSLRYYSRMQTNIDITQIFLDAPAGFMSIHKISKLLSMPYGTAYNRIHQLADMGVVTIETKGKAKECSLNPDNSLSALLLALGSAQKTEQYKLAYPAAARLLKKIEDVVANNSGTRANAILLMTPELFAEAAQSAENLVPDPAPQIIDFMFLKADDDFNDEIVSTTVASMFPANNVTASIMPLDHQTLLGMLKESESNAGYTAVSMLRSGILLKGFECFYRLILNAVSSQRN